MILVRLRDTFKERLPEWVASAGLVAWGLIMASQNPELWTTQYIGSLSSIASQQMWAAVAVLVGFGRIIALIINGAWRPTTHLRAFGAMISVLIWSAIAVSYISLPWTPPEMASNTTLMVLDLYALWYAAGDAKLADLLAKKKRNAKDI